MEEELYYSYFTNELCPVCNNLCKSKHWYDDSFHCDTNEEFQCNKCGYRYEYSYGAYREFINNKEFMFFDYCNNNAYAIFKKKRYKEIKKVRKLLHRNGKIKGKKLGINKNF